MVTVGTYMYGDSRYCLDSKYILTSVFSSFPILLFYVFWELTFTPNTLIEV